MNVQKKIRGLLIVTLFASFLFSASVTSCTKKADTTEESTEHPAEEAEHPKADSVQEHPTEADSAKSE